MRPSVQPKLQFGAVNPEEPSYDAPKKLVQLEPITARKEPAGGRRDKAVYSITPAGRAAVAAWPATDVTSSTMEFEGMMRVLFARHHSSRRDRGDHGRHRPVGPPPSMSPAGQDHT